MSHPPILRDWDKITADDFRRFPFWINCDICDQLQPWYDDLVTTDTMMRAWDGSLPIRSEVYGCASAEFTAATGKTFVGHVVWPPSRNHRLPQLRYHPMMWITERGQISFWYGAVQHFGLDEVREAQQTLCAAVGADWDDIFPISVIVPKTTFGKEVSFVLDGFAGYVAEGVEAVWRERLI